MSNIVALLALFVSMFALWEGHLANNPSIQIKELTFYTGNFASLRFLISNSGGRAVTINEIRYPTQVNPVTGISIKNKIAITSFHFYKNEIDDHYRVIYSKSKPIDSLLTIGYVINHKIEIGETFPIELGFDYDDNNPDINQIHIILEAHFSNGLVVPIQTVINVRTPMVKFPLFH